MLRPGAAAPMSPPSAPASPKRKPVRRRPFPPLAAAAIALFALAPVALWMVLASPAAAPPVALPSGLRPAGEAASVDGVGSLEDQIRAVLPSTLVVRGRGEFQAPRATEPSAAFLEAIERYKAVHACILDPACTEHAKRYVIVQGGGGLGNQLSGVLSAALLALLTDAALLFDIELGGAEFLTVFESPGFSHSLKKNRWSIPREVRRLKQVYDLAGALRVDADATVVTTLTCKDPARELAAMSILYSNQWWAPLLVNNPLYRGTIKAWFGSPSASVFGTLFRAFLKPTTGVLQAVESAKAAANIRAGVPFAGMHLRMMHADAKVPPEQLPLFFRCLGGLPSAPRLYIATDSAAMRRVVHDAADPHVSIMPVHLEDTAPGATVFNGAEGVRALVDMLILSSASSLVLSSWSSFGYAAFALSTTSDVMLASEGGGPVSLRDRRDHLTGSGSLVEAVPHAGVPFLSSNRDECVRLSMSPDPLPCFHHMSFVPLSRFKCWDEAALLEEASKFC